MLKFETGIRVRIVADDFADAKGIASNFAGLEGVILDWRPNPRHEGGKIPVIGLDDNNIICDRKLWWAKM